MKHITKLLLLAILVVFASCQNETLNEGASSIVEDEAALENEILVSDGEEDETFVLNEDSEVMPTRELSFSISSNLSNGSAEVVQEYTVIDADRDPFGANQPAANFWWPETSSSYFSGYFSSSEEHKLTYTEYNNGTANIKGTTVRGTCVVEVNVWLKDKKSWSEWNAIGGEHKSEGTAGLAANKEDLNYYVIDSERSVITANGGDCLEEGTFGAEQRPDPNDLNTPNYGAHVGPGGANLDSNIGADGISTWGWLTKNGQRTQWIFDFNFVIEPKEVPCSDCEGKVTELELEFDWHYAKRVKIYQKKENTCYGVKIFDKVLQPGEKFTIDGANQDGSIGKYAYIYINGCYYTKIKTNCYIKIGPGYTKGVFNVISGTSSEGGELCEYVKPDYNKCYRHWSCRYYSRCRYGY